MRHRRPVRRTLVCLASMAMLGVGSVAAQQPQGSVADYIERLVAQARHDDPRVRYSVREALRVMGPPALRALAKAKAAERDRHVRAFIGRTIDDLERRPVRFERADARERRGARRDADTASTIDIDRIAVEARLRWKQIAKLEPILEKARREIVELLDEHRVSGAGRDRRAWDALRGELRAIAKEIEPKLAKFLDSRQIKRIKHSLDRVSDRRGPVGPRGRGGRGEGGRGRGSRGGRS